jgi:predicted MPP superfamily phosphohydrolase
VSDLHVGPTTPLPLLREAFDVIRREQPDVLLLGGDYVYLEAVPSRLATLRGLVESVPCPVKLAVLGNHDLWTSHDAIVDALSSAGVRVLVNEVASLPAPWSDVVVIGLDDPWTGTCDATAAAAQLNGQPFRIVLCHSPDGLGLLSGLQFNVFLTGHTHGGQVAAPWGPIVLPHGRMCSQYPSGLGQFGPGAVYVSRGVGTVELPMRSFAPPDVMLLELRRPDSSQGDGAAQQGVEADEA